MQVPICVREVHEVLVLQRIIYELNETKFGINVELHHVFFLRKQTEAIFPIKCGHLDKLLISLFNKGSLVM